MIYFYLACFDLQHDKLRRLVVKELLVYGSRVQGSVFEIAIKPQELKALTKRLNTLCKRYQDPANIRFYRLSRSDLKHVQTLNQAPVMDFPSYKVI